MEPLTRAELEARAKQLEEENARLLREQKAARLEFARTLDQQVSERTAILQRGKEQWEQTFDAITDPVMLLDAQYRIARANLAIAEQYGRPITQVIGQTCWQLRQQLPDAFAPGPDGPCAGCPVTAAFSGRAETGEIVAQSGRVFRLSAYPMADESSTELVACTYRDLTEERKLEQQFAQTDKLAAVGRLAGGVAHEINNPLAAILAFAQMLRRGGIEPTEQGEFLGEIEQNALRCKTIVDALVGLARQGLVRERHKVALAEIVASTLPLLERSYALANVTIVQDLPHELPRVAVNVGQMQQVLLNLLSNAFDAMPGGGQITIRGTRADGEIELQVSDTGCGIAEGDLVKIFEPFYSTKGEGSGTGLGLAVTHGIIREHQGRIEVTSRVGEGTTMKVVLPAR